MIRCNVMHKKGAADISSAMLYTPLIQMAQNELTSRFVKRTTATAVGIAVPSLLVSWLSLDVVLVSEAPPRVPAFLDNASPDTLCK